MENIGFQTLCLCLNRMHFCSDFIYSETKVKCETTIFVGCDKWTKPRSFRDWIAKGVSLFQDRHTHARASTTQTDKISPTMEFMRLVL